MSPKLISITRYAVKGLSGEALPQAGLAAGRGLQDDRRYALALADTAFDPADPKPLPKTKFVVLMRFARLAGLHSRYDPGSTALSLSAGGQELASGRLDSPEGCAAIEAAVAGFMADDLKGPPRLVEQAGHRFTDVSVVSPEMMEAVSLINLASVRALEAALGRPVDPRRFRGNLLVDGLGPWVEFDWIGRPVTIGEVAFEGVMRTRRCAATEVDPETAERDIRLPAELVRHFGHGDLGIYLAVTAGGTIAPGDGIVPPPA